jgi:hypothetical protein
MAHIEDYVTREYHALKSLSKRIWNNLKIGIFNEDVFHDTLLKCLETLKRNDLNENEYLRYFSTAFKTNSLRQMKYAYHAQRTDAELDELPLFSNDSSTVDYNLLIERLNERYGNAQMNIFMDWLNGYTIRELNERHSRNDCRYVIDRIKKGALSITNRAPA